MPLSISKAFALPPTFVEEWRKGFDALRGPPSELKQPLFERMREPLKQPLFEHMREGADLDHALGHARAPARPPAPATTKNRRGAPTIHDWDTIGRLDDAYCRTYFADNNRAPQWKEREDALKKKLGKTKTPHLKTLQQRLPKIALLKERNSRSI
jgi:hypothetical protein